MLYVVLTRLAILSFGTLYPAYESYKAVCAKDLEKNLKWLMFWIVYALFICTETFSDALLSWFPFYYIVKLMIVMWLFSPTAKGSLTLYHNFVHPMLTRHEQEIDEYINQAKERGFWNALDWCTNGINYATNMIMQTATRSLLNNSLDISIPEIELSDDESLLRDLSAEVARSREPLPTRRSRRTAGKKTTRY